ncbi:aldehyde ferredoxin oxidoreductase [Desulfofundulus thermobenzoicus]|uniref:Aldehyde ferredoxin oxidoreductase n=1 Tax=Desulfofundulus thermobenzoicus TaxID=29376 RepID=A0A6N7ILA7_9FIRM|nr:aldehyde ferredoxin oxidoreductase family protein [Desulfofundulus thermobenzoicus]MQL50760.1 aldehyde ferredoxin oxidoreductase [Desulfofundulus thermobenzoicus]
MARDNSQQMILFVDLGTGKTRQEDVSPEMRRKFIGGNGFAVKILYDLLRAGVDPLGPENAVVFAVGPATGTVIPGAAMTAAATKSPLTGIFIDSYMGGQWGTELKEAGCEALVLQGAAAEPIYLFVDDGRVEIRPAAHLWGKKTSETERAIKEELGDPRVQVAAIGPAGENLVKFATIIHSTRAFGRGGLGAVLGSKKVKAIAVRGTGGVPHPYTEKILEYARRTYDEMLRQPAFAKNIPTFGSTVSVAGNNALGILGSYNWQQEVFADAEKISGNDMVNRGLRVGHKACASCIARSAIIWRACEGPFKGATSRGPEYETLYSYGSLIGNGNVESIILADRLSDELGLDTISTGAVIAFVMECVEKGILSAQELDGMDVRFGNYRAMLDLLPKIAAREGAGDLLAEGVREISRRIGKGSEYFAIHVKGLELPGHTARGLKGMGLGYATSSRGGSHQDFRPGPERSGKFDRATIEGKAALVKKNQDMTTIGDCLIVCRRHSEGFHGAFLNERYVELASLATGMEFGLEELTLAAERIYTLERMFNVREGVRRKDDTLPERFLKEGIPGGPSAGMYVSREELDTMLDEYYQIRGWDPETGVPTESTLKKLGLSN